MHRPIWGRSLYWRIVLGFGACIAGVLAVQTAAIVLWLARVPDNQRLSQFTHAVAADLGAAMAADPGLDIQRYINQRYRKPVAPLFIVLERNLQVVLAGAVPPAAVIDGAKEFWEGHPAAIPDSWLTGPFQVAPLLVNGQLAGGVGIFVPQSWQQLLDRRMALLSGALLILGTGLAGGVIVGGLRRRLRDLERAARRCGAGDFSARAVEAGDDELAALAASFNRMARDLGTRDELLKVSDRTRRMLLADVSHELMTPLTAMRAYREVLAMSDVARDPETAHCLDVIADETERLERLVGDLLDLARLEAGGDSLMPEDVAVENLFGRVAARHEPDARAKGVAMTTSVGAGAEILYGDPMRLEQALQNLASNALRHTPPGGEVELRAETDGDNVLLSVRDTGAGVAPDHLALIFERFYKVDQARTGGKAAGSGLGLSVVKAIVERHGGTISVTSDPNVATVFTICMPVGMNTGIRPSEEVRATPDATYANA
jgi:two-component system, OmpR family, sensor kinase